jgi:hypothetical protein
MIRPVPLKRKPCIQRVRDTVLSGDFTCVSTIDHSANQTTKDANTVRLRALPDNSVYETGSRGWKFRKKAVPYYWKSVPWRVKVVPSFCSGRANNLFNKTKILFVKFLAFHIHLTVYRYAATFIDMTEGHARQQCPFNGCFITSLLTNCRVINRQVDGFAILQ